MPVETAALAWLPVTILIYAAAAAVRKRLVRWWTSPLLTVPLLLLPILLALRVDYREYLHGTHYLLLMLGPVTVAFAVPVYEQRAQLRRHWPVLLVGVTVGSLIAVGSAWMLADWLALPPEVQRSLLPRSVTMPFAVPFSEDVSGRADLTALCVMATGVFGAALGSLVLRWLPLRSGLARGALFGMGAHSAGVARARELGDEEGMVAGLVMVLAGLLSIVLGPLLGHWLA